MYMQTWGETPVDDNERWNCVGFRNIFVCMYINRVLILIVYDKI